MTAPVIEAPTTALRISIPREGLQLGLLILGAGLLTLMIRLRGLGEFSFWIDEVISIQIATASWFDGLQLVRRDIVHPPLYYWILKLWTSIVGVGEFSARFLSVVAVTAALWPLARTARVLKMSGTATTCSMLLVATNPFLIWYSQQARMYAIVFLLASILLRLVVELNLRQRWTRSQWLAFCLIGILLVYSHYFGWFLVAAVGAHVLMFQRSLLRGFLTATAVIAVVFAPWVLYVIPAVADRGGLSANLGWIPRPSVLNLVWFVRKLVSEWPGARLANLFALAMFVIPIAAALVLTLRRGFRSERSEQGSAILLLAATVFAPMLLAFAAAQWMPQSLWNDRYLIISAPGFFLLAPLAIQHIAAPRIAVAVAALLAIWTAGAYLQQPHARDSHVDFRDVVGFVCKPDGIDCATHEVRVFELFVEIPFRYYAPPIMHVVSEPSSSLPWRTSGWIAVRLREGDDGAHSRGYLAQNCKQLRYADTRAIDYVVRIAELQCDAATDDPPRHSVLR